MFVQPKRNISAIISDDYDAVSEQIINLGILADLDIVALVDKSEKAIEAYFRLKPDVLLLNYRMKFLNGIETTKIIREGDSDALVVLFTENYNPRFMSDALNAGARGICLSKTRTDRIRVGIDCVIRGEVWLDEEILNPLICNQFNEQVALVPSPSQLPKEYRLSDREINVLQLVASGYSNKRIASELFISVETVKSHLRRIMERLSASDRTEAAVKAIRANIL